MVFGGFQKMTVLDFPGKIACILFTQGCNFRCPYCHNAELVKSESEQINEDEILTYLNKRRGILDGVCISGGEPLLHGEKLFAFMRKVKELGYLIKLDTNGSFPCELEYVIQNGLVDYVAMDIKNCKEKYPTTACAHSLDMAKIEKSVEILMRSEIEYEFRTTVTNETHTPLDFAKIGEWIKGAKKYYIQNFVPSENMLSNSSSALDTQALKALLEAVLPYVPSASVRGE